MSHPPSDTSPEAQAVQDEIYRRMSASQKLQRVVDLTRMVNQLALDEIRNRYPNATERELTLRLASRRLPVDLMRRAFNWDPEREGY